MPDYKASTLSGSTYTRAHHVYVGNPLDGKKTVAFHEEQVILLDGETITRETGKVDAEFTTDTAGTVFAIVNPETGEPTEATATYAQVYVLLHSLYLHLALLRDGAQS